MAGNTIDTTQVPETLTAPWLKRFFKDYFNIPVRVKNASSDSWVSVWISPDPKEVYKLIYHHHFPEKLGNRCLRLTYPNNEKLCAQNWGGNISAHSIALCGGSFRQLCQDIVAEQAMS